MKRIYCLFWLSLTCVAYSETRYVVKDNPSAASPYTSWATAAATIQDAVDAAVLNDIILVTNGVYDTGGRPANGGTRTNRVVIDKPIVVQSANGPAVTIIQGVWSGRYYGDGIRCVYLGVNAAVMGFTLTEGQGAIYCKPSAVVSNCILSGSHCTGAEGGTFYNCTLANNFNIDGGGAIDCTLYNCTLTGNIAYESGGGALGCTLYNCTLTDNWADEGGGALGCTLYNCTLANNGCLQSGGGGAAYCVLYNCTLAGNDGDVRGGGAFDCTLYNCTLISNSLHSLVYISYGAGAAESTLYNCTLIDNSVTSSGGGYGGGAAKSTLSNCIVYFNAAPEGSNYYECTLAYCCTTPNPGGAGNITNAPLFMDSEGGNLRLQFNSPCVNTGTNQDWMAGSTDLDGSPRIRCGQVDMGAYESDFWGQCSDGDADGLSDWIEVYRTGTDPTNPASYLRMGIPFRSDNGNTGIVVRWQSVADKTYALVRSTNLMETFTFLSNHLNATPPMNVYTDETATGQGPWYYRVGVE